MDQFSLHVLIRKKDDFKLCCILSLRIRQPCTPVIYT